MRATVFVLTAALGLSVTGVCHARTAVTTKAGCNQEFKGRKPTIKTCTACVNSGGRFRKAASNGAWSCDTSSAGSSSSADDAFAELGRQQQDASTTVPPKPKTFPSTGSRYVTIPAGSFKIGTATSAEADNSTYEWFDGTTVTISRPFLMKATEVTNGEWYFMMGSPKADSYTPTCGHDCALGHVPWREALEYLNALSKKEGFEACYDLSETLAVWTKGPACTGYRLPTQAEWEYAARGGLTAKHYGNLDDIAWHFGNSDMKSIASPGKKPSTVGTKAPNAYGLHDMLGSQWEWVWDRHADHGTLLLYPHGEKITDPVLGGLNQEETRGTGRIIRGGSFRNKAYEMSAMYRNSYPIEGDRAVGFRPVRTVSAGATTSAAPAAPAGATSAQPATPAKAPAKKKK